MKKLPFSTIDIQAKEWFDKVNGNSYFSCVVTTDYGLPTQRQFILPFQYGYGSHYESQAAKCIKTVFNLEQNYLYDLKQAGVIIRSSKRENCLKRDLFNPTQKEINKLKKEGIDVYPFFEQK